MPAKLLLDQYHQLLTRSKSFSILSKEQQAKIWNGFTEATDEQLSRAIKIAEADILQTAKRDAEQAANEAKAAEETKKMKEEQRIKNRNEMMEHEKKEREESAKAADELMAQLQKIPVKGEKKKLFGLF